MYGLEKSSAKATYVVLFVLQRQKKKDFIDVQ